MNLIIFAVFHGCILYFKQAFANECMPTYVDCYCENNFEPYVQITVNTLLNIDQETGDTFCLLEEYPLDVCSRKNCTLVPNENFGFLIKGMKRKNIDDSVEDKNLLYKSMKRKSKKYKPDYTGAVFRKRRFSNKLFNRIASQSSYPEEIFIPAGGNQNKKVKRSFGDQCEIPQLENSEVICWKWPNWITCNQQCIYGYGIETKKGTILKDSMNCRKTEDEWKPHPIQDCKPYINCRTHLKTPGGLNCKQLTKEPSYCEINCDEYDDHPAISLQKYICDKSFEPPHCAALDDSVSLIPAPTT